MDKIRILKERASEIAARIKVLQAKNIGTYISKLIYHDLWVQDFRKRFGIVPFSAQRITWKELFALAKKKIIDDFKRWRDPTFYE